MVQPGMTVPPVAQARPPQALPKKGWWGRNWKWFVPVGCLGMIVIFVGFVVLVVALVFGAIKSSDAYTQALAAVKASTAVAEALGSPIEPGFVVTGSINVSGPSGDAALAIPISGPKGKGTITVVAKKTAGKWEFTTLEVTVEGSDKPIDCRLSVKVGEPGTAE